MKSVKASLLILLAIVILTGGRWNDTRPVTNAVVTIPIAYPLRTERFYGEGAPPVSVGGPFSFAVDPSHFVYLSSSDNKNVEQIDWRGNRRQEFVPSDYSGSLSDMVIWRGRLYVGCFDEPKILIFDTSTGKEIGSKDLVSGKALAEKSAEPCVDWMVVDGAGNIHVIFSDGQNAGGRFETIFAPSGQQMITRRAVGGIRDGAITRQGDWVFTSVMEISIGQGAMLGYGGLRKLSASGKATVFDDLSTVSDRDVRRHASLARLIGLDSKDHLFGVVADWKGDQDRSVDKLVCWSRGQTPPKIIKTVNIAPQIPFSLYHESRRMVIGADDQIYELILDPAGRPHSETAKFVLRKL